MSREPARGVARAVLAVSVAVPLLRFAIDVGRGLDFLHVQYLVDDAFYYFSIARHPPEFNVGIPTSGFHPLYLALCWVFHRSLSPDAAIVACLGVLALAHSAAVFALYRCLRWLVPLPAALIGAAGLGVSTRAHALAMTGVETMLALAALLAFLERFARALADDRTGDRRAMLALGAWCGVAFLARMDAPLLLAPAAAWVFFGALRRRRVAAALVFAGASCALPLAWMATIRALTGSAYPNSGAALRILRAARPAAGGGLARWTDAAGVAVRQLDAYFAHGFGSQAALAAAALALAAVFAWRGRAPLLARFAGCTVAGFALWVGYYAIALGGFRVWYGLYWAVAVYAVAVPMVASLVPRGHPLALAAVALAVLGFSAASRGGPIAPQEIDKKRAALAAEPWLAALPPGERVGSFNAGVYQFYTTVDVLNLDGVVNPDAMAAHRERDIAGYMRRMNVRVLIEHDPSVTATFRRVHRNPALRFERWREVTGAPYAARIFKRTWLWRVHYRP